MTVVRVFLSLLTFLTLDTYMVAELFLNKHSRFPVGCKDFHFEACLGARAARWGGASGIPV